MIGACAKAGGYCHRSERREELLLLLLRLRLQEATPLLSDSLQQPAQPRPAPAALSTERDTCA